jgi:hypothetical protein
MKNTYSDGASSRLDQQEYTLAVSQKWGPDFTLQRALGGINSGDLKALIEIDVEVVSLEGSDVA